MFLYMYGFYCCVDFTAHKKKKKGVKEKENTQKGNSVRGYKKYFGVPGNAGSFVFIPDAMIVWDNKSMY